MTPAHAPYRLLQPLLKELVLSGEDKQPKYAVRVMSSLVGKGSPVFAELLKVGLSIDVGGG